MPNWEYVGDAYQWITDAGSAGIPVDQAPKAGDIAIRPRDPNISEDVGHAMYVAAVNGDGTITVWQYNEDYNGEFSIETRSTSGLDFIHFSEWQ
jgi:surface antigen